MSIVTLLIGIFLQIMFAVFQFMAVVFAGAGAAGIGDLPAWKMNILNLGIFLVPSISILVSLTLIVLYKTDSPYLSNWWHVLPFITLFMYLAFAFTLNGN